MCSWLSKYKCLLLLPSNASAHVAFNIRCFCEAIDTLDFPVNFLLQKDLEVSLWLGLIPHASYLQPCRAQPGEFFACHVMLRIVRLEES